MWEWLSKIASLVVGTHEVLKAAGIEDRVRDLLIGDALEAANEAFRKVLVDRFATLGVATDAVLRAFDPPKAPTVPHLEIDLQEITDASDDATQSDLDKKFPT